SILSLFLITQISNSLEDAPRVYLKLGDNLIPDDIKEGDDVYFECSVTSNPPHTRLNWFHEGREVRHNASQRVIISNNRLVLQKVTRHTAGNYTCSATNSQGSSQSNLLSLRVKFVPTCKSNTEGLIGAMKKETCEMAADPPKVEFYWTFNNSGVEVIHVPRSRFTYKGTQSVLNYTPINEMDYGTLACWGVNDVGKGMEGPCIFQIVSAGRPFPPRNCTIFNHTEDSLNIACVEGFDGGLPQHFVLEVIDFTAKKIKLNASSKMPSFSVEGMEPHVVFRFIVYSVNAKGRSEPFILDGITFRGVAKLTGETNEGELELNPLYAVIVGCFVVLIVFLIVAIIAVWKRSRRRKPPVAKAHKRDSENSNNFQTGDTALTKIDQNSVEDIGNPDVVPNKSGTVDI
ncbi:Nephrin, partial [Orchesella cincta]